MMYGSWDMGRDGQKNENFEKWKFWKNEKTAWRYYNFTHVCYKWDFGPFFAFLPH